MKKYLATLINNDDNKSYQHKFEAEDLNDAWFAVAQFCSQWNSVCDKLEVVE